MSESAANVCNQHLSTQPKLPHLVCTNPNQCRSRSVWMLGWKRCRTDQKLSKPSRMSSSAWFGSDQACIYQFNQTIPLKNSSPPQTLSFSLSLYPQTLSIAPFLSLPLDLNHSHFLSLPLNLKLSRSLVLFQSTHRARSPPTWASGRMQAMGDLTTQYRVQARTVSDG